MRNRTRIILVPLLLLLCSPVLSHGHKDVHVSALGDPGMRRDGLRVAFEAWNFCNEVGSEVPGMGSPRAADCFDLSSSAAEHHHLRHRVSKADNLLGVGDPFPGLSHEALNNSDLYAAEKELYLGSLCKVEDKPNPWQFWMMMLKNGNMDTSSGLCPDNGKKVGPFPPSSRFPCFGKGCMNPPLFYHKPTSLINGGHEMRGAFWGTYEVDADLRASKKNVSYFEVVWRKRVGSQKSWEFHHKLKTSKKYPWLMWYLRADATKGLSGGYHYQTRGMLKTLPESPNFKVRITMDVKKGGGPASQFYLLDIGSCWKNNGEPCDGDVKTDVTRYSEMIINPATSGVCSPETPQKCPPYHIMPDGKKIHRNDTANFPFSAYHYYCAPGNAKHAEEPYEVCDPYSNPQPQEIIQLLPHPVWGPYGYPTKKGQGWVGDKRTWLLHTGDLSSKLPFYQDPGTRPARRIWTSIDAGTEIYVSKVDHVAEWILSDFDVLLPHDVHSREHHQSY
ncbi:hypothetical protein J5N97_018444 [Dioscorea zingiberensis]|uniref:DUF7705 domain-containing protein n=1 Tax=Dioscorea zingiberensis TaxID=325984 RepID=A0A9D5CPA6_9LILI|nr:hypothetical protein J5N97_018444 [Dioscorea zingiberensis]